MNQGDYVRAINEELHELTPIYYPPVGTIGVFHEALDDGTICVRWPEGSTSAPGVWFCWPADVEFVDE